jgi:putative cell wall-binding protein
MARVFGLPDVARLDLSARTANGGVKQATATSSGGATRTITGDQFRMVAASGTNFSSRVNSTMIRHRTQRIGGDNRYAVAAAVARTVAPGASSVVVASGENANLPDASVAGPLASTLNAPLLLADRSSLPAETAAELTRRGSALRTAYVLGGEGAVSATVVQKLRARGLTVVRVAGDDRYETAAQVAREIRKRRTVTAVMLAGGFGLADALAGSGPASALKEPILLTPADRIAPATADVMADLAPRVVHIVGGTAVVGQGIQAELEKSKTVRRLGGADRYAVSATVANYFRGQMPSKAEVVVTSGQDASLVDSLVAGTRRSLMVLVRPTILPPAAAEVMQRSPALETVTAVGGTAVVSNSVLSKAATS